LEFSVYRRNIIEKMHMTATLTRWYNDRGRHEIFAGNKKVPLTTVEHSLTVREDIITRDVQHDLEKLGIAKTAREEKLRARDAQQKQREEDLHMARLYRKHVLKEQDPEAFVPLGGIAPAKPVEKPVEEREEVGSFGD
jgi:hypothetical protein